MAKIDLKDYLERLEEPEDREAVASREYQRELFEQYVQKGTNFPELRAQLLEEYRAGAELTGPQGLRRKLGAVDLGYFGRAYLPHYFVRPSPPFHEELDPIFREGVMKGLNPATDAKEISRADGCRRAVEAPRGHAKSTNFTFKDSIHSAVYAYKHYEIILSDSSEQAEGFLSDIKTELEENAALREDFGELVGRVWKASVILLSNGVKIEALGAGKKIRGRRHKQWRPDLILCDDLENDENVNTAEQRKKLRDWFYKAVSKAGDTYTDIVYIGTLLHYDALLANVAKNPEYEAVRYKGVISFAANTALWDAWERIFTDLENPRHKEDAEDFFKANEAAMLEGTAVLWEEKLPYYALMVMRVAKKLIAQEYPHVKLPAVVYATVSKAAQLGETFELEELVIHNDETGSSYKGLITAHWNEYTLTVVDRFGNVDETFPALPGVRSKAQYKAGAVVAVALAYGDSPAIIGEVQL